jgi:endonuclease/exonuclease/phosphatase family metal-dependent hydrolase
MTFNIRYDNPADGEDAWPKRRAKAASMVRFPSDHLPVVAEIAFGEPSR